MNIQIFGKSKCFETKKAQRYFKERRIKFQYIDLARYGMSRGELKACASAAGLESLIDEKADGAELIAYLARDADKLEKLFDEPHLIKTPVVRNGKLATVGYCPMEWSGWD